MPKQKYESFKFRPATVAVIEKVNEIVAQYAAQGFDLTLRQTFYQFVSRGWCPNTDREYKKLGDIISNGRMAGLIDWEAIVDRTRFVRRNTHWNSPHDIVSACADQFALDKWKKQPYYPEVWIEKDALVGVIEGVCRQLDVAFYACRGYSSVSEVWNAGSRRIKPKLTAGKKVRILYLGDHDPSGIDMTRDVGSRLSTFTGVALGQKLAVERLALNMDQVEEYAPPPNPTKLTDSRADAYIEEFGEDCWELDALEPTVIRDLIENRVLELRDEELWNEAVAEEVKHKKDLKAVADHWTVAVECAKEEAGEDPDEHVDPNDPDDAQNEE